MEKLEEFNQLPEDTKVALESAINVYETFKDKEILSSEGVAYNNQDKKCLALFLGLLKNDNLASKLLSDFNVTYEKVLEVNNLPNIQKKLSNIEEIYMQEFHTLIELINDSDFRYYTRDLTTLLILDNLFLPYECLSSFLDDIYVKLGLINSSQQAFDHYSFSFLTKQLELAEEKMFSSLETKEQKQLTEKLKISKNNECLSEELGLNPFGIDLSFGRDNEIKKLMVSLLMPDKSVILVGPSGVGKTALVKGFAHRIATKKVPDAFLDKKIVSLNVASLVSGCKYVGMFEEKFIKLLKELEQDENIIVFIDEIHTIIGAGKGSNNGNDMANILKPYLESGKIKIIGATTDEEYEKYIKSDSGLKRRLELVKIVEPDEITLENICENVINRLEQEMNITFLEDSYITKTVIKELIKATDKKHRVYNDFVNNPDLIVSIITRSFAISKYYDKQVVDIDDLIESVEDNDRLYSHANNFIIKRLKALKQCSYLQVSTNDKIINFTKIKNK